MPCRAAVKTKTRHVAAVVSTLLLLGVAAVGSYADIADGELEFVRRLTERGMFDLAERCCLRRLEGAIAQASSGMERAEWEMVLSECYEQHAWHMNSDSRFGLLSDAAERLTDFLTDNHPGPDFEILLRVRQIELLGTAVEMDTLSQSHVLSRTPYQRAWASLLAVRPELASVVIQDADGASGHVFALEAAKRIPQLTESLLRQIAEIRRDVDPETVRACRDRCRFVELLTRCCQVRQETDVIRGSAAATAALRWKELAADADKLAKSVTDESLRFRCRLILADACAEQLDEDAFRLRISSAASTASDSGDQSRAMASRVRGLLTLGKPSDALQVFVDASRNRESPPLTQELYVLRVQSLLELADVLWQLNDSPERTEALKRTEEELHRISSEALQATSGLWMERVLQIRQHYERMRIAGPESVLALEVVASLTQRGQVSTARELLRAFAERHRKSHPDFSARLLVQCGQLGIRTSEYETAASEFLDARNLFQMAPDHADAASADLLRIFAVGQQWAQNTMTPSATDNKPTPDGTPARPAASGVSEAAYKAALDDHLITFPESSTTSIAREWMARLVGETDPVQGAELWLKQAENQETSGLRTADRLRALCHGGDLLLMAIAAEVSGEIREQRVLLDALVTQHARLAEELCRIDAEALNADRDTEVLLRNLCRLHSALMMLRKAIHREHDWNALQDQLSSLRQLLTPSPASDDASVEAPDIQRVSPDSPRNSLLRQSVNVKADNDTQHLIDRAILVCMGFETLCAHRRLQTVSESHDLRRMLLSGSRKDRLLVVRLLLGQLTPDPERSPKRRGELPVGDPQIAHFLIDLLQPSSQRPQQETVSQLIVRLKLLLPLSRIAESSQSLDDCLTDLLSMTLDEQTLPKIAEVLAESGSPEPLTGAGSRHSDLPLYHESLQRLWSRVQKNSQSGSGVWLESSLQMARQAAASGNFREANRIFRVVDALHPEWGSPERRARADSLRQILDRPR